jgi:hypothetical protein
VNYSHIIYTRKRLKPRIIKSRRNKKDDDDGEKKRFEIHRVIHRVKRICVEMNRYVCKVLI